MSYIGANSQGIIGVANTDIIDGGTISNATLNSSVTFPTFVPEIIAALRFDGSDGSTISLQTNNLTASRNGTGDYTLTFGSARSSIDYLVFHSGVDVNNNYLDHLVYSLSTTGFSLEYRKNGTAEDVTESHVIVLKFPL